MRNKKPGLHWFDLVCMNCAKHVLSIQGTRFLGGWIPHMDCGYETLFKAAKRTGVCPQIASRLVAPANHNQALNTTLQCD